MTENNKIYIYGLDIKDVPWHRLTTAYGRGTDFPNHFETLQKMKSIGKAKNALHEISINLEHQSTLWHTIPFAMVFLSRILIHALSESEKNPVAQYIARELFDFFDSILQCFHDADKMEHEDPLPLFSDMLKEEYLWSEKYDEEEDEIRYEEEDVFPDDLFYSFYYYSWQAVLAYKEQLELYKTASFVPQIAKVLAAI